MYDQITALYLGLKALLSALLLQPAALWLTVLLMGLFGAYAVRKTLAAPRLSEHDAAEQNRAIHKCAFQSNLLAMNAAVEAARAETEHRELVLRMERIARDTRSVVEQKIGMSGSRLLRLDAGAMDELALLLEESNRSLSDGPLQFDPQMMQHNVSRIERIIEAA